MEKYQGILSKCKKNPEWAADTIVALKSQMNKDSHNSSKPLLQMASKNQKLTVKNR
ncbi:hypothetical protein NC797_11465 [Aquibacillus sp. 3ASR75-11]|uniref:Uncharacterized protein n=1 Tax=Terrihalobacillus insolitus TaxID=2950438 RepID=A0A9X4AMS8_9BACI|nr:hypothetical protein [Terrihalobacillus insolitus]MDC3425124.1 hypothetical protein [Terrihalobacillus insolitus]